MNGGAPFNPANVFTACSESRTTIVEGVVIRHMYEPPDHMFNVERREILHLKICQIHGALSISYISFRLMKVIEKHVHFLQDLSLDICLLS